MYILGLLIIYIEIQNNINNYFWIIYVFHCS
jgi:hypothetical protein